MWNGLVGLCAAAVVLAACSSGNGSAVSDTGASAPVGAVESSAAASSPPPNPEPSSSPSGTLLDCLQNEGFLDITSELEVLLDQTSEIGNTDIQTEADLEGVIEAFNEQGTDYDKVARQLKAFPDCGDSKWGVMTQDLGDLYVEVGSLMSGLTLDDALSGEGVDDVNEISALIRSATNQVEVTTDYMTKS